MKSIILSLFALLTMLTGIFFTSAFAADLTIYTYESFNSEWGPGPVVFKRFEEQCGCKIKVVTPGDSGTVLNRVILEKANPKADILLGLNNSELEKSFSYDLWIPYRSPLVNQVQSNLLVDKEYRVTPFDYGFISFVYDSQKLKNPPRSLEDLLDGLSRFLVKTATWITGKNCRRICSQSQMAGLRLTECSQKARCPSF